MMKISKTELHSLFNSDRVNPELRKKFYILKKYCSSLDPAKLDENLVQLMTEMDNVLFTKWKISAKFPAYFGLVLASLGLFIQILIITIILNFFDPANSIYSFIFVFLLAFIQSVVLHAPAHYIIGLIFNIKTKNIFIAKSSIRKANNFFKYFAIIMVVPGLKYDLKSFLESSRTKRALFIATL